MHQLTVSSVIAICEGEDITCSEEKTSFPLGRRKNGRGEIERGIYVARAGWRDGRDFRGGMRMMSRGGECARES